MHRKLSCPNYLLIKKKKNILLSKERSKCQVYSLSSLHSIYRFALVHHIFFQFDMRIGNLLWNFCTNFLSSVRSSVVVDWGLICYLIILVAKKGSTAQHPARSCKEVRDFGDSIGDVEYWIDPENKRNPFRVYCDMKTDGSEPSVNDLPTKGV